MYYTDELILDLYRTGLRNGGSEKIVTADNPEAAIAERTKEKPNHKVKGLHSSWYAWGCGVVSVKINSEALDGTKLDLGKLLKGRFIGK